MADNLVLVACKILPGAFSGERGFQFTLANGELYHSLASREYFRDRALQKLPVQSETTDQDGYIAALPLKKKAGYAIVEVPDGEHVCITKDLIRKDK